MPMVFGQWYLAICMLQAFGYMYDLPIGLFLFNRLRISREIAHFLLARSHLYIQSSIFHPSLCRLIIGNYLALGHENVPAEASFCMPP